MTLSIKHNFVSAKTDGVDTTLVQPSNWNEEHDITLAAGKVMGRDLSGAGAVQELPLAFSAAYEVTLPSTTGSMIGAKGTTAQRPGSPVAGMFRYNTDLAQFDAYDTGWRKMMTDEAVTAAIAAAIAAAAAAPVGTIRACLTLTADTGWVRLNGKTLGNAASGATERADADTAALFAYLWNNLADAQAAVSGGRTGSAAADYALNKTIALPSARDRFFVGHALNGHTDAALITAFDTTVMGKTYDVQQHGHQNITSVPSDYVAAGDTGILVASPGHTHVIVNDFHIPPAMVVGVQIKL